MKQFIQYTYDLAGNRTRMIEPGGGRFTCAYDSLNRLSTLENPQSQRTTFSYDDNSRRTASRLSNGSRASFTYDAASNVTRLANLKSDLTTLSSFDYRYDKVNNRQAMIEGDGARTTYSYDNTYQLLGEFRTGSSAYRNTHTYDNAANRTLKNESGTRTTTTYDAANQINYALASGGRTTYTYDADGNQQKALEPSGARTTTLWDYENKTKLVQLPSGVRNTMAYEPDGLRVKLQESAGEKRFVLDGQAYLLETNSSNVTTAVWTQMPTTYGNLISQRRGSTTSWAMFEANGSTRQLLDASQNVTDSYLYDAFGNVVTSSGSTVNPFQWHGAVGYYRDGDTGLYYVRARILNPRIAVWTSTDPLLFVNGPNLYRLYFVPNGFDPSGYLSTVQADHIWKNFIKMMDRAGGTVAGDPDGLTESKFDGLLGGALGLAQACALELLGELAGNESAAGLGKLGEDIIWTALGNVTGKLGDVVKIAKTLQSWQKNPEKAFIDRLIAELADKLKLDKKLVKGVVDRLKDYAGGECLEMSSSHSVNKTTGQ